MDFRNTKIRIKSPEHSKAFQEGVFDAGGAWGGGNTDVVMTGREYLYVDSSLGISWGSEDETFENDNRREIVFPEPQRGHPHAELMAAYAEDARTNAEPWNLWQVKLRVWESLIGNPVWNSEFEYRRKPKFKIIHGVEVPDISFVPKDGEHYFHPDTATSSLVNYEKFNPDFSGELRMSELGLCYPYTDEGKQAAIIHAKIMLGIK